MKKSRLIAQCLLKAGMVPTVADGEFLVELNFRKHFPDHQYPYWNLHVNQDFDELLPELRRQEHSVDIRQLIEALW